MRDRKKEMRDRKKEMRDRKKEIYTAQSRNAKEKEDQEEERESNPAAHGCLTLTPSTHTHPPITFCEKLPMGVSTGCEAPGGQ